MRAPLVLLLVANASFALTVRVSSPNGAPRIVVDGQPVRARMFWGAPGSAPISISNDWQSIQFEFTATDGATNGTMHIRFGQTQSEVELQDIRFDNHLLSRWIVWPPDRTDRVRASHEVIRISVTKSTQDFHIYSQPNLTLVPGQRYTVRFRARATPPCQLHIAFYRPGQPFVRLGGPPDVFESQIRLAANVGVRFVSFPIHLPWPKPGEAVDWKGVDAMCETVLRANPQALLLPRIGMNPPPWWREAHPEEVMQWDDGHRDGAVPSSPRYRHDAAERLTALIRHLEEKFGNHVAGYHPTGQNTGEWFYLDTWKHPLNGYAPADFAAWRQWLKMRGKPEMPVPTPAERRTTNMFWSASLVDWAQFQQKAMADCILELARAARKASGGRKLVVFFYGYVFEFGPVANGPATSGHYALRRVLECPDIDVLCSPISYFDRGPGGSAPSMSAAESVALAGKLWLNEDDTHTYRATGTPPGWRDHVTTLEETNALLARNVAQEALRHWGTWWMDLGASGWFNDAGMWAVMKRLEQLDEYFLKKPTPFRPEVAAVIDEASMLRVAPGGVPVSRKTVYEGRAALGRMGTPYGQYLLDDVLAGRVQAKLFVFVNGWCFTPGERARVARIARERGHGVSLFVDENGVTSESLRQAARAAGVHLFTETDCNVYANGPFLALHASQDGPLSINTGRPAVVRDVLTGEAVGQGPRFTLPMRRGETRVFFCAR
jgi:beta-galactosidase